MYGVTPHCTTQHTSYYLLFDQDPMTKLPETQSPTHPSNADIRTSDSAAKRKLKVNADRCNHARNRNIQLIDNVLAKQTKQNKLSTNSEPTPLLVTNAKNFGDSATTRQI